MPSDFWQNDRALLRATAVTRGGTDIEKESAQKVNSSEENSPAAPAGTRTRNLSISSQALFQQACVGAKLPIECQSADLESFVHATLPAEPMVYV